MVTRVGRIARTEYAGSMHPLLRRDTQAFRKIRRHHHTFEAFSAPGPYWGLDFLGKINSSVRGSVIGRKLAHKSLH